MTEIVKHNSDVNLDDLQQMAKMLVLSGYFEASQNQAQGVAQMATKILAGRELGYGPFASVQGIHVIKGKPALSANLMAAAVKAHPRYDYRVRKLENDEVSIEFFENKESIGISKFTKADAIAAQTQNLAKFPRNMLFARAMSNGVRFYCPDVFYGNAVYTPEELGANVDGDGNISEFKVVTEPTITEHHGVTELAESTFATVNEKQVEPTKTATFKKFMAEGTTLFNGQWDTARHWMIEAYTQKTTPDNVRKSANDLTDDELNTLASSMKKSANWFKTEFAKQAAPGAA